MEIDWDAKTVNLSLRGSEGEMRAEQGFFWEDPDVIEGTTTVGDAPPIMRDERMIPGGENAPQ